MSSCEMCVCVCLWIVMVREHFLVNLKACLPAKVRDFNEQIVWVHFAYIYKSAKSYWDVPTYSCSAFFVTVVFTHLIIGNQ